MSQAIGGAFKLVGGRPCLDFVNTVGGRVPNPRARGRDWADRIVWERLQTVADLVRWARVAGVASERDAPTLERALRAGPTGEARLLRRVRRLREALYRLFKAVVEGWPPERADLARINRELRRSRSHERLVASAARATRHRPFDLAPDPSASPGDRFLGPVVKSAAELLMSEDLAMVKQCGGEECGWLFLDTSRNRSRRWCDMADCGNLAKVRRWRLQQ